MSNTPLAKAIVKKCQHVAPPLHQYEDCEQGACASCIAKHLPETEQCECTGARSSDNPCEVCDNTGYKPILSEPSEGVEREAVKLILKLRNSDGSYKTGDDAIPVVADFLTRHGKQERKKAFGEAADYFGRTQGMVFAASELRRKAQEAGRQGDER